MNRICTVFCNDSEAILLRISALFPGGQHFYQKSTLKNSQIILFCENDLKHEITLVKKFFRKESNLPISLEKFISL